MQGIWNGTNDAPALEHTFLLDFGPSMEKSETKLQLYPSTSLGSSAASSMGSDSAPLSVEEILRVCFPYRQLLPKMTGSPDSVVAVYTPLDGKRRYIIGVCGILQKRLTPLSSPADDQVGGSSSSISVKVPVKKTYRLLAMVCDAPFIRTGTKFARKFYNSKATHGRNSLPYSLWSAYVRSSARGQFSESVTLATSMGRRKFWADVAFDPLFYCFSCNKVREILGLMLCGEKVVLTTSRRLGWLPQIWESLLALLGPFDWPFVYCPMLPMDALGILEAPTPFLVGIYLERSACSYRKHCHVNGGQTITGCAARPCHDAFDDFSYNMFDECSGIRDTSRCDDNHDGAAGGGLLLPDAGDDMNGNYSLGAPKAENITFPFDVHVYDIDLGKKISGTKLAVHPVPRIFFKDVSKEWRRKNRGRCFQALCPKKYNRDYIERKVAKDIRFKLLESTAGGYKFIFNLLQRLIRKMPAEDEEDDLCFACRRHDPPNENHEQDTCCQRFCRTYWGCVKNTLRCVLCCQRKSGACCCSGLCIFCQLFGEKTFECVGGVIDHFRVHMRKMMLWCCTKRKRQDPDFIQTDNEVSVRTGHGNLTESLVPDSLSGTIQRTTAQSSRYYTARGSADTTKSGDISNVPVDPCCEVDPNLVSRRLLSFYRNYTSGEKFGFCCSKYYSLEDRRFLRAFTSERNLIWQRFVECLDPRFCFFLEINTSRKVNNLRGFPSSYFVDEGNWDSGE